MANLRQSMTDEEWDNIDREHREEVAKGRPDADYIYLWLDKLSTKKLVEIKSFMEGYDVGCTFDMYIDKWIKYRRLKETEVV